MLSKVRASKHARTQTDETESVTTDAFVDGNQCCAKYFLRVFKIQSISC